MVLIVLGAPLGVVKLSVYDTPVADAAELLRAKDAFVSVAALAGETPIPTAIVTARPMIVAMASERPKNRRVFNFSDSVRKRRSPC